MTVKDSFLKKLIDREIQEFKGDLERQREYNKKYKTSKKSILAKFGMFVLFLIITAVLFSALSYAGYDPYTNYQNASMRISTWLIFIIAGLITALVRLYLKNAFYNIPFLDSLKNIEDKSVKTRQQYKIQSAVAEITKEIRNANLFISSFKLYIVLTITYAAVIYLLDMVSRDFLYGNPSYDLKGVIALLGRGLLVIVYFAIGSTLYFLSSKFVDRKKLKLWDYIKSKDE